MINIVKCEVGIKIKKQYQSSMGYKGKFMQINIGICDDERVLCTQLEETLIEILIKEKVEYEIEVFWTGKSLCESMKERKYDLIFLDIELPDMDGIAIGSYIRETLHDEQVQIAYLHGQMKATEKNRIMESFAKGDIDVLVSTTVIEVGIDVPNATVMMIENAERFGLAQLNQLRGRVGRGKEQSYCIFINTSDKKDTSERLSLLNKSNDGFYIAGEDLRLRGPGDLFGIRQSGSLAFRIADIFRDAAQLKAAGEAAELFEKELEGVSVPISVDFRSI